MKLKALDKLGGVFAVIMAIGYLIGGSGLSVVLGVPLFVIYMVLTYQEDKAKEDANDTEKDEKELFNVKLFKERAKEVLNNHDKDNQKRVIAIGRIFGNERPHWLLRALLGLFVFVSLLFLGVASISAVDGWVSNLFEIDIPIAAFVYIAFLIFLLVYVIRFVVKPNSTNRSAKSILNLNFKFSAVCTIILIANFYLGLAYGDNYEFAFGVTSKSTLSDLFLLFIISCAPVILSKMLLVWIEKYGNSLNNPVADS